MWDIIRDAQATPKEIEEMQKEKNDDFEEKHPSLMDFD